jgi:DNA mismatch endonuclease (patch repair protein)
MRGNRRRDTQPERRVRSVLHARGLRFRVDYRVGTGRLAPRPDLVFTRRKIAVFIDGCFWHGCPDHGRVPAANNDYWAAKLSRNVSRDRLHDATLERAGWHVLRFWEHEDPEHVAVEVAAALSEPSTGTPRPPTPPER